MRRLLFFCLCIVCLSVGIPVYAQPSQPTQTNLTAIFAVNSNVNMTTAMYSVGLEVGAEFAPGWLFPLPPDGTLLPSVPASLRQLVDWSSEPMIGSAPDLCDLSPIYSIGDGPPSSPQIEESPLENITIVNADDATAALADAGMALDDTQRQALADYEREGWSFAWLEVETRPLERVNFDNWFVQLMPFVVVQYPGSTPILPMRFHAPAAQTYEVGYDAAGVMSVQAFVFADEPYLPDNYARLTPDLSDLSSGQHNLSGMPFLNTRPAVNFDQPYYDYYDHLRGPVSAQDGLGYSLEFIGSVQESFDHWQERYPDAAAALDSLSAQNPTLTRIQTFLAPDQPVPDMTFAPASTLSRELPDPYTLHTWDYYIPLRYWGCTSRTHIDPQLETRLPTARTYIDALHLNVAHPDNWQLSIISRGFRQLPASSELPDEYSIYVLAPNVVDYAALQSAELGTNNFPMLVIALQSTRSLGQIGPLGLTENVWQWFTRNTITPSMIPTFASTTIYAPRGIPLSELANGGIRTITIDIVQAGVYVPQDDLAEDEAPYLDMLNYLHTRQYLLSSELQHSLFLGNLETRALGIGYPSDWVETYNNSTDEILILPTDATAAEDAPYIRITPLRVQDDEPLTLYGETIPTEPDAPPTPFETERRRGFLLSTGGVFSYPVIEFSAPVDDYEQYAPLFNLMLETMQRGNAGSPRG